MLRIEAKYLKLYLRLIVMNSFNTILRTFYSERKSVCENFLSFFSLITWFIPGNSANDLEDFLFLLPEPYALARDNSFEWVVEYMDTKEGQPIIFNYKVGIIMRQITSFILFSIFTTALLRNGNDELLSTQGHCTLHSVQIWNFSGRSPEVGYNKSFRSKGKILGKAEAERPGECVRL